jgi:hypothetical protein
MRIRNITNRKMKMIDYEYIVEKIINALTHPGELMTDGECIDEVWSVLKNKEYDLNAAQAERESYYNINGKEEYIKEYL